jgi:alpha,alpha-trehalase
MTLEPQDLSPRNLVQDNSGGVPGTSPVNGPIHHAVTRPSQPLPDVQPATQSSEGNLASVGTSVGRSPSGVTSLQWAIPVLPSVPSQGSDSEGTRAIRAFLGLVPADLQNRGSSSAEHKTLLQLLGGAEVYDQQLKLLRDPKTMPTGLAGADVWDDPKTFADCRLLRDPEQIRQEFLAGRPGNRPEVEAFFRENFALELPPRSNYQPDPTRPFSLHLQLMGPELTRDMSHPLPGSTRLSLPHPQMVPGARFNEGYYNDTCEACTSNLQRQGILLRRDRKVEAEEIKLAVGMINNLAYQLRTFGKVPNGTRAYYLSRTQLPDFASTVEALAELTDELAKKGLSKTSGFAGATEVYKTYVDALTIELTFLMKGAEVLAPGQAMNHVIMLSNGMMLFRHHDEATGPREEVRPYDQDDDKQAPGTSDQKRLAAESMRDMTMVYADEADDLTTLRIKSFVTVELNCHVSHLMKILLKAYRHCGMVKEAGALDTLWRLHRQAVVATFVDLTTGRVGDHDLRTGTIHPEYTAGFVKLLSLRIVKPDSDAAKLVRRQISRMREPGGFSASTVKSGQQWEKQDGWAPDQRSFWKALLILGEHEIAKQAAFAWTKAAVYQYTIDGLTLERYDISDPTQRSVKGEYGEAQPGFLWTNELLKLYLAYYSTELPRLVELWMKGTL